MPAAAWRLCTIAKIAGIAKIGDWKSKTKSLPLILIRDNPR
jgi:hypothetical protein